ncbi:MAG: HNH endonuclease signature motif containing protein [Rhodobacteraceae bacterium]|nr:HNH endonuclease signature motif containing protein [Paracoccaceae bacterium]MCY4309117.1 HNH endonuclease signature motif containing protein [Paracoccaceae bacterium]
MIPFAAPIMGLINVFGLAIDAKDVISYLPKNMPKNMIESVHDGATKTFDHAKNWLDITSEHVGRTAAKARQSWRSNSLDAKDVISYLPKNMPKNMIESVHDGATKTFDHAKNWLDITSEHVGRTAAKARQSWRSNSLGAVAASSRWREYMPDLYDRQKGKDALCGNALPNLYIGIPWINRRLNPGIEVDHVIPRSLGGSDEIDNLQLTRREYNRAKGNKIGPQLESAIREFCPR